MLEAEWVGRAELVVCGFGQGSTGQKRRKTGQGRAGQGRMMTGKAAFLGFSSSDILVVRTRVSAMCICQHTFAWLNFLAYIFSSSSFQYIFGQTFCDLHTPLHTFLDFLVNIKK